MNQFTCNLKSIHNPKLPRHQEERFVKDDQVAVSQWYSTAKVSNQPNIIRYEIEALYNEWFDACAHLSVVKQQVAHDAFLALVGIGKPALPFIFEKLAECPMLALLKALKAITREDVARNATHREAVELWRDWGINKGFIR
jgi:hypothetical protein